MEEEKPKILTCNNHGLVASDVCLYGSPLNNRLLCKICKQNLSKEELLEVISITDFTSGNFLQILDSMIKQVNTNLDQSIAHNPLEQQINKFFGGMEESIVSLIRQSKETALKAIGGSDALKNTKTEIGHRRDLLTCQFENILLDKGQNMHDDQLLNDFAQAYISLTDTLTGHLNKNSSSNKSKEALMDYFDNEGKNFTNLKQNCEKYFTILLKKAYFPDDKERSATATPRKEEAKQQNNSSKESSPPRRELRGRKKLQNGGDNDSDTAEKIEKKVKTSQTKSVSKISPTAKGDGHNPFTHNDVSYIPRIKCIHTLATKHKYIFWSSLCYVDDQKHLISGGTEGNMNVWDVETKDLLFTKHIGSQVYKIIYVKQRGLILVTSESGSVSIFDANNDYELLTTYQAHPKKCYSVAYLAASDLIASCGEEGNIALWTYSESHNLCSNKRTLDTNKKQVSCLCYIEDQNLLVAGMLRGGLLMVFQPDKSKCLKTVKAHQKERSVDSLLYVPAWKQLVSGSEDSHIKFWDFSNIEKSNAPACLKTLMRDNSFIESIALIPEEKYLFHSNLDDCFSVWNLSKDKLMENIRGHSKGSRGEALLYIKDRKELVTAFTEELRFWKIEFIEE